VSQCHQQEYHYDVIERLKKNPKAGGRMQSSIASLEGCQLAETTALEINNYKLKHKFMYSWKFSSKRRYGSRRAA
jgi:hypothetical protein